MPILDGRHVTVVAVDSATNTTEGSIRIATDAEASAGTLENVAINPKQLIANVNGVVGGLVYIGAYNATTPNHDLTQANKGHFYKISHAGTIAGVIVNVGDHIVFNQDANSPVASTDFDVIDSTESISELNDLSDVSVSNPSGGQVLRNNGAGNFVNAQLAYSDLSGTPTIPSSTDDLTSDHTGVNYTGALDASITTHLAGIDSALANAGGASQLNELSDVSVSNPSSGQVLRNNGAGNFVNTQLAYSDLSGTPTIPSSTTDITEGNKLYYTDARVDTRIGLANIDDLNDVAVTNVADGQVLLYNSTSGDWENGAVPSAPVTRVNTKTGDVVLATGDIAESGTNYYYTEARFNTSLSGKSTTDLSEGTNLYYTETRFNTSLSGKSTTDLSEGTNLYYTDARVDTRFDTRLATKTTTDVAEGNNLYFTDARADARADVRIGASALNALSDVSYTAGQSIDNYVLTYNNTSGNWEAEQTTAIPPSVSDPHLTGDTTLTTHSGIEEIYIMNNSSVATLTILTASTVGSGFKYQIKRTGTANVIVQSQSISAGNNQIDGESSYTISNQYESITLVSDGSTYHII